MAKIFMDIQKTLANFKKKIDPEIEKYLDKAIGEAKGRDNFVADALKYVKKITLAGGKRLRPALMYYGYLGVRGKEKSKIVRTAVGIELIHTFLLIHDDIIDKDNKRHNEDTIHFRYQKLGKNIFSQDNSEHFGNSMGIIMGDMVSALGNQIIFNSEFSPELIIRALSKLQSVVSMTVIGEAQDVYMGYRGEASEKEILEMYKNKTAKYTIESPLHLGAILGGADDKVLKNLTRLSIPIGVAFQIQDDILGVFGSERKIGKSVGSDIQEGKQTILVSKALENSNRNQKKALNNLLGKNDLTFRDIKRFREIIKETGSLNYAQSMARKLIHQGKREINKAKIAKESKDFLLGMADYTAEREV